MRHSQSHLTSLAMLLQNAEARRTATPPPAAAVADDSGLIDIAAMQAQAREERARATVATRTPIPMVRSVRSAVTDPDLAFSLARTQRRKKQIVLGMILGAVGLVAVAIGSSRRSHPRAPISETHVVAAAPPPAPSAPPATPAPVAPPPATPVLPVASAPSAGPEVAASPTPKTKSKKRKHSAKSKGPKLTKVMSSGVP